MVNIKAENLLYGYNEITEMQERLSYLTNFNLNDLTPCTHAQAQVNPDALRCHKQYPRCSPSNASIHVSTVEKNSMTDLIQMLQFLIMM